MFILILMRAAAFLAAAAICGLALSPTGTAAALQVPADKVSHFVAFYVLTLLTVAAFTRMRLMVVGLLMLGFGGAIEVLQSFVGRDAQWGDLVADALGIACALAPLAAQHSRALVNRR